MTSRQCSVNDLSDEILSLIIYQLHDPGPFSMACRRFYEISRDPYVRASYFLVRYGRLHAFYWALSRGRLMNERVLNILQTSGAHLSRYLIQVAIHHYFRTTAHFIKNQWARAVPYHIFIHFMSFANRYGGDLPLNKGEDDGTVFQAWLKERLNSGYGRKIELDVIRNLFQKYGFMIFSPKDPLVMQLPLAFAMEPSLLPLAISNGFHLDSRYRDFIFRKMFEKSNKAGRTNEIVQNVRQMTRLDKRMILSRTVAAEVCMECRSNESGYSALKILESSNDLHFSLKDLVNDLLQLFLKTRSITYPVTILTLQTLFRDFAPSPMNRSLLPAPTGGFQLSTSRQVMFITIFCAVPRSGIYFADHQEPLPLSLTSHGKITCDTLRHKLKNLGLLPVTKQDLLDVLVSPWCEDPGPLMIWAKEEMDISPQDLQALVEEVTVQSLPTNCKGKLLQGLFEVYSNSITDKIKEEVLAHYQIDRSLVPDHRIAECSSFQAPLNIGLESKDRPFAISATQSLIDVDERGAFVVHPDEESFEETFSTRDSEAAVHDLGVISQDTLSYRIQLDTESNLRVRRRHWPIRHIWEPEMHLKKSYPCDATTVGQWIYEVYGASHAVTAIFMTHAIINTTEDILKVYLNDNLPHARRVPITMKHFHIMAKLGKDPSCLVWQALHYANFYMTEDDYINSKVAAKLLVPVKMAQTTSDLNSEGRLFSENSRKRPRRNTVSAPSYLIPDSDDEAIQEDGLFTYKDRITRKDKKKANVESNLQAWIKHLSILLKEEERKYKEKKKRTPKDENGRPISRCLKGEFMKSLAIHLRALRTTETVVRKGGAVASDGDTDCYDEEFVLPHSKNKKRRFEA